MGAPDLLVVCNTKESQEILKRIEREASYTYQTLTLSEEKAANVLYINGTLIHRSIEEIPVSHQVCGNFSFWFYFQEYCFLNDCFLL